jgi:hypothetical protein
MEEWIRDGWRTVPHRTITRLLQRGYIAFEEPYTFRMRYYILERGRIVCIPINHPDAKTGMHSRCRLSFMADSVRSLRRLPIKARPCGDGKSRLHILSC